jgi:hypothetical protein
LELKPILERVRRRDGILRNDAAIPFHFHLEVVTRQDRAAKIKNVGEAPGLQAVLEIFSDVSLQHAGLPIAESAAAIDKLLCDVADLGDMNMRRDLLAARQDKTRGDVGMRAKKRFDFL